MFQFPDLKSKTKRGETYLIIESVGVESQEILKSVFLKRPADYLWSSTDTQETIILLYTSADFACMQALVRMSLLAYAAALAATEHPPSSLLGILWKPRVRHERWGDGQCENLKHNTQL